MIMIQMDKFKLGAQFWPMCDLNAKYGKSFWAVPACVQAHPCEQSHWSQLQTISPFFFIHCWFLVQGGNDSFIAFDTKIL